MKIVIDTNIVVSAILFGGKPLDLLHLLLNNKVEAFASAAIVEEYQEIASRLIAKYPAKPPEIPLNQVVSAMQMIKPKSNIKVCRDPDDDKFISCAVDGKCIYIVSGDKDLLSLEKYEDVEILTIAEFFERYNIDG